jgi:hypothetical protein
VRALRLDIRPENVDPVSRGEDQIALLSKADIGIGPESIFQTPEKVDHDLRHQNVLRRRELLTHTTGRTGSAAGGKRRVLLNDNDSAAIEGTQLSEAVGRGASDDATAYDHNVLRPTRHALTMGSNAWHCAEAHLRCQADTPAQGKLRFHKLGRVH